VYNAKVKIRYSSYFNFVTYQAFTKKEVEGYKEFLPHEEGLNLDLARIKDWLDYLHEFPD